MKTREQEGVCMWKLIKTNDYKNNENLKQDNGREN